MMHRKTFSELVLFLQFMPDSSVKGQANKTVVICNITHQDVIGMYIIAVNTYATPDRDF